MDDKTLRRLLEAEQRIATLERQLSIQAERPAVSHFPRERWLGVTTRIGSDYPTETAANTFGVKLLSAAFTPVLPGPSTVSQRERGTTVIARTWPSQYIAEGTQVIVDRLRGVQEGGEWWIASSAASQYIWPAEVVCTISAPSGHVYQDGSSTPDVDADGAAVTGSGVWLFPGFYGGPTVNSLGTSVARNVPTGYASEWLRLLQATFYVVTIHTQWRLPSLSLSDARTLFRANGHDHTYTDGGTPMTTGLATPDVRGLDDGGVVRVATYLRETTSGGMGDNFMGSSTLRPFYSSSGDDHLTNHSQVITVLNAYRLTTLRIKVVREDTTPYVMPRLGALRVHIRQCDPASAGPLS